jgi:hypothetical protein
MLAVMHDIHAIIVDMHTIMDQFVADSKNLA